MDAKLWLKLFQHHVAHALTFVHGHGSITKPMIGYGCNPNNNIQH